MSNLTPAKPIDRPKIPKLCPCDCGQMITNMICRESWASVPKSVKDQLASPDRELRLAAASAVFAHAAEIKRLRLSVYTPSRY